MINFDIIKFLKQCTIDLISFENPNTKLLASEGR